MNRHEKTKNDTQDKAVTGSIKKFLLKIAGFLVDSAM
jgi:hypothetical protein